MFEQHFKQTANGLDIDNADFNVNVSLDIHETIRTDADCDCRSTKMAPSSRSVALSTRERFLPHLSFASVTWSSQLRLSRVP